MSNGNRAEKKSKSKNKKKYFLPIIAGVFVLAAIIVMMVLPAKKGGEFFVAETDKDGNVIIHADRLSGDQVSFIRISEDSRIELLAKKGDDGTVKVALGTCQSCNGSPGAYYTQEGDTLKCNNCGLTFPLSVLDAPGGGCHPMMLDESAWSYRGADAVIHAEVLSGYEDLFAKVADH